MPRNWSCLNYGRFGAKTFKDFFDQLGFRVKNVLFFYLCHDHSLRTEKVYPVCDGSTYPSIN